MWTVCSNSVDHNFHLIAGLIVLTVHVIRNEKEMDCSDTNEWEKCTLAGTT